MRVLKLTFLLLLIISCKQNKEEIKPELKTEIRKTEILTEEEQRKIVMDSVYELYRKGIVEKFDWDLVFNKADQYRKVSETYSDKELIPKDFLEFSQKFISDSEFQKAHIDFEKLIAVAGCEETYVLKENNWVFDNYDFVKYIGIDDEMKNTFYLSDSIVFCEYEVIEVGIIRMLGFEKKDNQWYLTLYDISGC